MLTKEQQEKFWIDGYLVVENIIDANTLKALQDDFTDWAEESRNHSEAYGVTIDGRPRFDMDSGHTPENPTLRRVNAPVEMSEAYYEAANTIYDHDRCYRNEIDNTRS